MEECVQGLHNEYEDYDMKIKPKALTVGIIYKHILEFGSKVLIVSSIDLIDVTDLAGTSISNFAARIQGYRKKRQLEAEKSPKNIISNG